MPVVPSTFDPLDTYPTVYQRLSEAQQRAGQRTCVATLAFPLATALHPLQVLAAYGQPQQRHFYYDRNGHALVALGVALEQSASGPGRFQAMQRFVDHWQTRLAPCDPQHSAQFFCSLTFFDQPTTAAHVFLPQWQVTATAAGTTVFFNCLLTATTPLQRLTAQIDQQLRQLNRLSQQPPFASQRVAPGATGATIHKDVVDFEAAVQAALAAIAAGQLHKVVLADVLDVISPRPFQVTASLAALRQAHPDCYIFSVGDGQGRTFLGASPERLLSIHQGQLSTDALAGSAPRGDTPATDATLAQRLLQSPKERYEHRVVVDFIAQQLRSQGLVPEFAPRPDLLQLANIQHLHTPIRAGLPPQVRPLEILAGLHPTPAVAGLPRRAACDLIRQQETFERGAYAAPLGWLSANGDSEFIVGIRSALIQDRRARLYAGAGIVAGSDPERELAEVKLKLQTLLAALV